MSEIENIEIVPLTEKYLEGILYVEENTFSIPWTKNDFLREINENKMAIYFVAIDSNDSNRVIGYAGMWHVINEGHITNVAVLHDYRGRGISKLLMDKLIDVATEYEMIGITLEVRINNSVAQKLYNKYGFKCEGIRKNYYEDTKEDAVVMWKYFPTYENYSED